ncbi:MAG: hypothetical protein A4E28_01410 [Methanocella sp. PtaU1.Bin125]|nr:MAG: hypothetical protein A4E28_01410 [Methanocella sp. PtaU1.Bin125]
MNRDTLDLREIAIGALCVLVLVLATRYLYAHNDGFLRGLYLCPAILLIVALVILAYDAWKRVK